MREGGVVIGTQRAERRATRGRAVGGGKHTPRRGAGEPCINAGTRAIACGGLVVAEGGAHAVAGDRAAPSPFAKRVFPGLPS